jgi:gluconolactonase
MMGLGGVSAGGAELSDVVAGEVSKVVGDCQFTEGPAWHPDGFLLFSDIPNNRIVRVDPDGAHRDWMTESQGANGLMADQRGYVYAAQGGGRQIARLVAGVTGRGLVDRVLTSEFEGKPFNRPNDLALDGHGGLYFTDPMYSQGEPSQPVQGVYYLAADGTTTTRVVSDLPRPNGILVSRDGRWLVVANPNLRQIMRYEIVRPGQLSAGEVLFTGEEEQDGNGPDGMSFDEQGNLYATYKSLVVLSGDGQLIGRVAVPEKPSNCAFGGSDNKTLYITARTSLYALPMKVAGMALQSAGPGDALAQGAAGSTPSADATTPGAQPETRDFQSGPVSLKIPTAWKEQAAASNMRLAQFVVPRVAGDAEDGELVIFPPFGGTPAANVQRWIDQFASAGREVKMTQGATDRAKYIWVDLTGTYNMSVGPPILRKTEAKAGYRMLAVMYMVEGGGNYFFKLTGPQKTVAAAEAAYRASFQADSAQEHPYSLSD